MLSEKERQAAIARSQAALKLLNAQAKKNKPAVPKPACPAVPKPRHPNDHYHYAVVHLPGGRYVCRSANNGRHAEKLAKTLSVRNPGQAARAVRRVKATGLAEVRAAYLDGAEIPEPGTALVGKDEANAKAT